MTQNTQNIVIGLAIVIVAVAALLPTNRAYDSTNHFEIPGTNRVFMRFDSVRGNYAIRGVEIEQLLECSRADGTLTNLVNLLVTSGEFCRVRGHVWKDSTQDYINEQPLLMFTPRVPFEQRTCGVCGTNQFRSMPPWPGAEAAPLPNFTNLYLTVTNMVMTNITVFTNLFQYYDGGTNNYIPLNDFVERRDLPH